MLRDREGRVRRLVHVLGIEVHDAEVRVTRRAHRYSLEWIPFVPKHLLSRPGYLGLTSLSGHRPPPSKLTARWGFRYVSNQPSSLIMRCTTFQCPRMPWDWSL